MVYLHLLRPKHWVKNLFLFIPAFFSGDLKLVVSSELLLGFITFCMVASAIYVINDLRDIKADQLHPKKKLRPIASGKVNKNHALIIALILIVISLGVAYVVDFNYWIILTVYLILNILYSFGLKNVAILDMLILSAGFVIRVVAGGYLVDVLLSQWLIIMVFLLSLFIAAAKRRDDVLIKLDSGQEVRASSNTYNLIFINSLQTLLSGVMIVSYLMYTLSPTVIATFESENLFYTSIFVIAGVIRYLQLSLVENNTGSPTEILYTDRFIQISIVLWLLSFYLIIYLPQSNFFH